MEHAGIGAGIGLAVAGAGAGRWGRDLDDAGPGRALGSNAVCTEDEPIDDVDDADLDRVIRPEIYGSLQRSRQFAASPSTPRYRYTARSKPENSDTNDSAGRR